MTSDEATETCLAQFVEYRIERMVAWKKLDVAAVNRATSKAAMVAKQLISMPVGRQALELLLVHPTLHLRVDAAMWVIDWAPEKVIPIFGRLLDDKMQEIESPDERLDIRLNALDWLYGYFNIRTSDRNDLIEPLRAYGVELARKDRSRW